MMTARAATAQTPDALFQSRCAGCHNAGNAVGAPLPDTLRQMTWQAVLTALETGKMTGIGDGLSPAEREAIAKYIGTAESQPILLSSKCSAAPQRRTGSAASNPPDWNGWSDAANTRF